MADLWMRVQVVAEGDEARKFSFDQLSNQARLIAIFVHLIRVPKERRDRGRSERIRQSIAERSQPVRGARIIHPSRGKFVCADEASQLAGRHPERLCGSGDIERACIDRIERLREDVWIIPMINIDTNCSVAPTAQPKRTRLKVSIPRPSSNEDRE